MSKGLLMSFIVCDAETKVAAKFTSHIPPLILQKLGKLDCTIFDPETSSG
jgi:hypothetical protein